MRNIWSQQVMLCYPHLYWVDRRELTSCHHCPDLGTPASYHLMHPQQVYPVPTPVHTLQLYLLHLMYVTRLSDVQLSRDYKWSPPSAEHHLTFDAAVSVSPTHMRDHYIAVCMMSSFSSVGWRGFLFLQCRPAVERWCFTVDRFSAPLWHVWNGAYSRVSRWTLTLSR